MPLRECADCGRPRELVTRGLCMPCRGRCRRAGTIADFGYLKPDRLADYADLRSTHSVVAAARRLGLSERTGWRYEQELREMTEAELRSAA
jgi:hypothetical protein